MEKIINGLKSEIVYKLNEYLHPDLKNIILKYKNGSY